MIENNLVQPETVFLSAKELFQGREHETAAIKSGLKKRFRSNSLNEVETLSRLLGEMRDTLSRPRIERAAARTQAFWDSDLKAVKVTRKEGKFKNIGYAVEGILYLEYFEALFLLEMNRLELHFNSMIVSLEQAYLLLLGSDASDKYNIYLVYSTLSRAGYNVQKHKNSQHKTPNYLNSDHQLSMEEECVWEILNSSLNKNCEISEKYRSYAKFQSIKNSMDAIDKKIRNQENTTTQDPEEAEKPISGKRKITSSCTSSPTRKRAKLLYENKNRSFIDCLKNEPEYQKFEAIFKDIDVITLREEDDFDENCRSLYVTFDIYNPTTSFKKSDPQTPDFRVVVLGPGVTFPNRSELLKMNKALITKSPILITTISQSKHIQTFLYYFT